MSKITVSKKDLIWSYLAIIFQVGSGVFVLPFVLRMLSADEVGFNYIMLTIAQLVTLFDSGFGPMFGKNLTFIFSGAKSLKKEGIVESKTDDIDYHLLASVIKVGKTVYLRLSIIVLILLLTGGTAYTYYVTHKFTLVPNGFIIWLIYSFSIFFNVYYSYLGSFMIGRSLIKEIKKATIFTRITYIVLAIILLYCNLGLLGLAIANFIAPFVLRFICMKQFYDSETKENLKDQIVSKEERKTTFEIIWHNAKKMVLVAIGAYCVNRVSLFLSGLFLDLTTVASYGLMLQLGGIISSLSTNYFNTEQPKMSYFKVKGDLQNLKKEFSSGLITFILLSVIGFSIMVVLGPWIFQVIKSQTHLPTLVVMIVYSVVSILENNHSICANLLVIGNRVPPVACSLIPGIAILILTWIALDFFHWGLLAIVIIQGICQAAYNNWKWPFEALKELEMNPIQVVETGFKVLYFKFKLAI